MQQLGKTALVVGVVSLVLGVGSRLTTTPIVGVESYAIVEFAKVCFVLSVAASLAVCKK